MVASPEHPELFVEKKKKMLKGAVAHGDYFF